MEADPTLVRGCFVWDRLTTKLNQTKTPEDRPFYLPDDYENLKCRIEGNRAEVTVGSAIGHKTHITLTPEGGTVEYYDTDPKVNMVMSQILGDEIGLACTIEFREGVKCRGLRDDKVRDVFKALAMATSMDIRLDYCEFFAKMPHQQAVDYCMKRERDFYRQHVATF